MSATKRGGQRILNDAYYTPAWCVDVLLDEVGSQFDLWDEDAIWLEPCVGNGAIVNAVDAWAARNGWYPPAWILNDIAPQLPPDVSCTKLDYTLPTVSFKHLKPTMAITNPPFAIAEEVTRKMLEDSDEVLVLQRLAWASSEQRNAWFRSAAPSVYALANRVSFTADGRADSTDYAWFHFTKRLSMRGRFVVLPSVPKEVRRPTLQQGDLP